jgi:hypothetical protein
MICNNIPLLLVTLLATCKAMEPEPAMYSTDTATTTPAPVHTVSLKVALGNVNAIANTAQLVNEITASMVAASGGNSGDVTVNVTIQNIKVTSVFGGLTSIVTNSIITAYSNMTGIPKEQIMVNGNSYSSGGRRLSETATVVGTVTATGATDVVAGTKQALAGISSDSMVTSLKAADPTAYGSMTVTALTVTAPTTEMTVITVVTGVATAPTTGAITTQLTAKISGGANITSVSVTTVVYTVTTTQNTQESGAPILSLITGWFVCSFLLMA